MSDQFYRQRAARRRRLLIIVGTAVLLVACGAFGAVNAFRDSCTGGFERSPRNVVESYVTAVIDDDGNAAQRCWEHDAYYDLEAGCSEICLERIGGTRYELVDLTVEEATTENGRGRIETAVTLACPDGEQHSGLILLDSVAADWPWKHWKIIHSTVGGPLADPWCQ